METREELREILSMLLGEVYDIDEAVTEIEKLYYDNLSQPE